MQNYFYLLLCTCVCASVDVYVPCTCVKEPAEVRRELRSPGTDVRAAMCGLGTEVRSFVRVASALSYWAILPALSTTLFQNKSKNFKISNKHGSNFSLLSLQASGSMHRGMDSILPICLLASGSTFRHLRKPYLWERLVNCLIILKHSLYLILSFSFI